MARQPATRLESEGGGRQGTLALALQEVLTAVARVRTDRPVAADSNSFRHSIKQLLATAGEDASRAGYSDEAITLSGYAVIAFLDESVLNSSQPMFADWPRKPLQEEVFGEFLGGEVFFDNVNDLMGRRDSEETADVLEVYLLCVLLGFKGRYATGDPSALEGLKAAIADKIVRVRGVAGDLSPSWMPPQGEVIPEPHDRVLVTLRWVALGALVVLLLLWIVFWGVLWSGRSGL